MKSPISSSQLPQCSVCNLDPAPQSTQHILLLILQCALVFIDIKLSIILLMIGYSFPRTVWKCPFCKRQVNDVSAQNNLADSVILRMGNCMALFSLNKFRIFSSVVVIAMIYLIFKQPIYKPRVSITKTWQSLIQNCGYQAYIQNSVKANHLYTSYIDSGMDWQLQGIFLKRQGTGVQNFQNLYIKMNPTQFKDPDAYDFKIFSKVANAIPLKRGDVLKIKGQWQGRQYYDFIFNAIQIQKTNVQKNPQQVEYYYKTRSMLRSHFDSIKSQYEKTEQNQADKKEQQKKMNVDSANTPQTPVNPQNQNPTQQASNKNPTN